MYKYCKLDYQNQIIGKNELIRKCCTLALMQDVIYRITSN